MKTLKRKPGLNEEKRRGREEGEREREENENVNERLSLHLSQTLVGFSLVERSWRSDEWSWKREIVTVASGSLASRHLE